jgi:hypothetical protein
MTDTVVDRARDLQVLVDVLLPGDDLFPSGATTGVHGVLAERLRLRIGVEAIDEVTAALASATGGVSLAELSEADRITAVQTFEQSAPGLFAVLLSTLYYSYYEHPLVIAAIRSLGIAYNDAPQPLGYDLEPFTPIPGVTVPTTPRGFYLKTDEVRSVEIPPAAMATESRQ